MLSSFQGPLARYTPRASLSWRGTLVIGLGSALDAHPESFAVRQAAVQEGDHAAKDRVELRRVDHQEPGTQARDKRNPLRPAGERPGTRAGTPAIPSSA